MMGFARKRWQEHHRISRETHHAARLMWLLSFWAYRCLMGCARFAAVFF
jgi:hypothetical protein